MKITCFLLLLFVIAACTARMPQVGATAGYLPKDSLITQSLFNDRTATLSEENIAKILEGQFRLPRKLRVGVVQLSQRQPYAWNDEEYVKNQQTYLEALSEQLKKSDRVTKVFVMPELMIAKQPTITALREAGVRVQADALVILSTTSDIYTRYKVFGKSDVKAFATTQVLMLDMRTGLIPFTQIITRDTLSQKAPSDTDIFETRKRVQHEAVQLTMAESGTHLLNFLRQE